MTLDEVVPGLFLGGAQEASNFELLTRHNITHILNCAKGLSNSFPEDFTYKDIPLLDDPTESIDEHFECANDFIEGALRANGSVLVHCHMGLSRGATVVLAYLMQRNRWHFAESLSFLLQRRRVNPNLGFVSQLKLYQRRLFPEEAVWHYACGRCSEVLFESYDVLHCHGEDCGYFVGQPLWMECWDEGRGAIQCYKCRTKVGVFSWDEVSCECGFSQCPSFYFDHRKVRVDQPLALTYSPSDST